MSWEESKYFPIDPVWTILAKEDRYYFLKSKYRLTPDEYTEIKNGPKMHICKECKKCYDYYESVGVTNAIDPDYGTTIKKDWRQCTQCTLGRDYAVAKAFTNNKDKVNDPEFVEWCRQNDPAMWLKTEFGVKLRFYQERTINCSAKWQIWRFGRRTGKTFLMAAAVVYAAFIQSKQHFQNNPNSTAFSILALTPDRSQILKLQEEIVNILQANESYNCSYTKPKEMSPYGITFDIGIENRTVVLRCFCAGDTKKSSVRGQGANLIVMDEADFIPESVLSRIITPIMLESPDTHVIMASSTSGLRGKFWQLDTMKSSGWVTHHYRSIEQPSYTYDMDMYARMQGTTKIEYALEFDCVYSEATESVFSSTDIERATYDYEIPIDKNDLRKDEIVIVGVDWNDRRIGTHILVVGFSGGTSGDSDPPTFRVLDKIIFTADDSPDELFHQNSCKLILEKALYYGATYIYCDAGYGSQSIELVRTYIDSARRSNPNKIVLSPKDVRGIDMHSNIEVKDPVLGIPVKKQSKTFFVNYLMIQLEHGRVVIPRSEHYKIADQQGLITQMYNFKKKKSDATSTVYDSSYDHTLTALILCCGAFGIEYGELISPKMKSFCMSIGTSDRPDPAILDRSMGSTDEFTISDLESFTMWNGNRSNRQHDKISPGSLDRSTFIPGGIKGRISRAKSRLYRKN